MSYYYAILQIDQNLLHFCRVQIEYKLETALRSACTHGISRNDGAIEADNMGLSSIGSLKGIFAPPPQPHASASGRPWR